MTARTGVSLWRIAKHTARHPAQDLSGEGARLWGGRWNRKGTPAVYSAGSISLAILETLAHLWQAGPPEGAFLIRIDVPAEVWKKRRVVRVADLPGDWAGLRPHDHTLDCGDQWLAGADSALLAVPSVIVPEETNVLLNPSHADAVHVTAQIARPFAFDLRLGSAW